MKKVIAAFSISVFILAGYLTTSIESNNIVKDNQRTNNSICETIDPPDTSLNGQTPSFPRI